MIAGLGIDLVEIARVERLLAAKGDRALRRLFTAREIAYAASKTRPAIHLAARLAAKEAAFKALAGTAASRGIGWREVEVSNGPHGPPAIMLHGGAKARAHQLGIRRVWVSLTHTATTAAAVVVLECAGKRS
ncbi:MAG: holo-[acyl-carrier-protein] synthase [Gemmatimonadaceae bacterium]